MLLDNLETLESLTTGTQLLYPVDTVVPAWIFIHEVVNQQYTLNPVEWFQRN